MTTSDPTALEPDGAAGDADDVGGAPVDRHPALAEADVRADPQRSAAERETIQRVAADEETSHVYTAEPGVARRVLHHSGARVTRVLAGGTGEDRYCGPAEVRPEDTIHAVWADLPVGFWTITTSERTQSGHAGLVSPAVYDGEPDGEGGSA